MKKTLLLALGLLLLGGAALAQQPTAEDRVAALKASLASSRRPFASSSGSRRRPCPSRGSTKAQTQERCYFGADGKLQKVPVAAPPPAEKKRGLRGKIAENKKEELSDYMKEAVALVKSYLPPDPAKIDAVKAAGRLSVSPQPGNRVRLTLATYLKPADSLNLEMNLADNTLATANVASTMDSDSAPVSLVVTFAKLDNGAVYEAKTVLDAKGKELRVSIEKSGYRKMQ